jgi:hypothetical protein
MKTKNYIKMNLTLKENYSSINLFNKITLLEYSTISKFTDGMLWVKNNNINGCLVGGTAVVNYLSKGRDLTPDIDYLVSPISDIKSKLTKQNISFKTLKDSKIGDIGITVEKFNMDFLDANVGNTKLNELILKTYTTTIIGGEKINIVNPELLTIMKLDLSRVKDINDAFELLKSGLVNKDKYITYVNKLKPYLQDYESIISYSDLID